MTETFAYDGDNNLVGHTDFRGKVATYTFDRRYPGRLVAKIPDPSLGEPTVTYSFSPNSIRSGMTDASGVTTYGYDLRNRLLTKATPEGTLTYAYDPSGNVASINSSNSNGTAVSYAWDPSSQLVSVTDNRLAAITNAAYTATGRLSTLMQPNGVKATYGYDAVDRVTSLVWQKAASQVASWEYAYNGRGQRLTSTDLTGRLTAYGYDAASRLASETITNDPHGAADNGAIAHSIDPVGNRLSRVSTLGAVASQSLALDANDQLTTDVYDSNGNTTQSGGNTFTYDFENRILSKNGGTVTITYDGDGNRVAKTSGGVTTHYLVDELNPTGYLQVLEEVSTSGVQTRYTYGSILISQTRDASGMPAADFYGSDAQKNVTFLTSLGGDVTNTYQYDSWGNLLASTGNTPNTRLYGSQEVDSDLGLVNLRARQYLPSTGRFLTIDPLMGQLQKPRTLNRYLYSDGDPINLWDPNGKQDSLVYPLLATIGILILAEGTDVLMAKKKDDDGGAIILIDSWPVPPTGNEFDPCLSAVFNATTEWLKAQSVFAKAFRFAMLQLITIICGTPS